MLQRKPQPPLILVVGMTGSIHLARWISAIRNGPFRVVVFPSIIQRPVPELQPAKPVSSRSDLKQLASNEIGIVPDDRVAALPQADTDSPGSYPYARPVTRLPLQRMPDPSSLGKIIHALKPDLIHSMELQHGGYLVAECKRRAKASIFTRDFPPWLASSWGSDIFLYKQFGEHRPVLRSLLQSVDGLHSDCERDLDWAQRNGFSGFQFPQMPASMGIDYTSYPKLSSLSKPSERRTIFIKGYHHWAGRGVHILLALHLIAPYLKKYKIVVAHASKPVAALVEKLRSQDGLDISVSPYLPNHADTIARLASARVAIGYGISDGISTTLLEAMSVGTFVIQANTCCGKEWVIPGETGLLVSPHDIAALSRAILLAATNDDLVDGAAQRNRATVEAGWCARTNGPIALEAYQEMISSP
ncbi:glycosyltransferase family 4 protein [Parahaliea aestuarii]|uniref:Glycosyltransferase family 4 protein n=1 Tax=Parahaliea aestuarii TaxID=1852021 RepID=A0A5C8ZNU3_9GAMM|nr:glycosyltransferase family 4 protein [Parahaliea aestuarii]TXS89412.1 glycosyltransferase family 4 protein [Parahaliea aestuarii]